ncbi:MAG: efflux RND transporter periplasmic adaptor subunit, partial [Gammaproteobacteria bacterium]|nr:efflux RND transporter periplasmic adaptor subunit [Gammaproteobacteria bacterium]
VFNPIEIIGEDEFGIWVAGLPNEVELITVGQHGVSDGERVLSVSEASLARPINEQG